MAIYFVFSDEAGNYKKDRSKKFLKRHPFFIRVSLLLDSIDWINLNQRFYQVKKDYGIPKEKEVKWSYIWALKEARKHGTLSKNKDYYFLKDFTEDKLIEFVESCLGLLSNCTYCKLIYTVTLNDTNLTPKINPQELYKMHIQDTMQRIEMEIQNNQSNLAILFLDPINNETDNLIRESYKSIYLSGDFIKEYRHIKDSLSFELSHHSFGIQLADYCVGIFNNTLKGFPKSINIFKSILLQFVRKNSDGNFMGYGVVEIPKNDMVRKDISNKISSLIKC